MKTEAIHFVNRADWAPGPWDSEPDRVEWRYRGLPCLVVRSDASGALCGYVGVPPGHPWHGKETDALDAGVRVHGGVTYAAQCCGHICHVPRPGETDNVWWVGFDCAHAWDVSPRFEAGLMRYLLDKQGVYRDLAYVRAEVERLADQAMLA